jgi:uncharacterized protein (UPF0335 family)
MLHEQRDVMARTKSNAIDSKTIAEIIRIAQRERREPNDTNMIDN